MNSNKIVITAALSGGVTRKGEGRGMTPYIPISPDELAADAKRCYDAGASVVHVHARDPKTQTTWAHGQGKENVETFREISGKIKAKCPEIIVNFSTGGGMGQDLHERLAPVVEVKPEFASYTSGSMNFAMYSKTDKRFLFDIAGAMTYGEMMWYANSFRESNTKPECEIYCHSQLANIKTLEEYFVKPINLQFVMGMPGQVTPATPNNLIRLYETAQEMFGNDITCSVCVAGLEQWKIITQGAILGMENIRTGMEDNIYMEPGVLAKSNAEMVEKAVMLARGVGREVATVEETRKILGITEMKEIPKK